MKSKVSLLSLLSEIEKAAKLKPSRRLLRLFARRLAQIRRGPSSEAAGRSKVSRLLLAKSSEYANRGNDRG